MSVRPEDISLHREAPSANGHANVIEGRVIDTVYLGCFVQCRVGVGDREFNVQVDNDQRVTPNEKVFLSFRPEHGLCLLE